jgi:SAM-dependent methyltransferase
MALDKPASGADGYLTDVAYVRNYVPELSPGGLRAVAALNGFPVPAAGRFDYCELGSASGDTLVTLAAALPGSRFVGVELNPQHVATAAGLAARGGLSNARFVEGDFAAIDRSALPAFDFMAAHGVFSWVSPATRQAVIDIAADRLRPGGLLYLSYNALPGWAALEPLRRLMLDAAIAVKGDSLEKARQGLRVAGLLSDAGARYFSQNPEAQAMLGTMARLGAPYVAHEYFHGHWSPMYFADVARDMAARGLYFVGQLPLHLNFRDLAVPPSMAALFKGVQNRIEFETLKDYALNEFFRRDVYIKGGAACSVGNTHAFLESTPFTVVTGGQAIQREVALPHHVLRLAGPLFDALFSALEAAPATAVELAGTPGLASSGLPAVRDALLQMVLAGQVWPAQAGCEAGGAHGALGALGVHGVHGVQGAQRAQGALPLQARTYRLPLEHNRLLVQQPLSNSEPVVLASPVVGTGLRVSMLGVVCVRLLTEAAPAGRRAWLRAFIARHPLRLHDRERPVSGEDEQLAVIERELEQFCERRLPELIRLGVLVG